MWRKSPNQLFHISSCFKPLMVIQHAFWWCKGCWWRSVSICCWKLSLTMWRNRHRHASKTPLGASQKIAQSLLRNGLTILALAVAKNWGVWKMLSEAAGEVLFTVRGHGRHSYVHNRQWFAQRLLYIDCRRVARNSVHSRCCAVPIFGLKSLYVIGIALWVRSGTSFSVASPVLCTLLIPHIAKRLEGVAVRRGPAKVHVAGAIWCNTLCTWTVFWKTSQTFMVWLCVLPAALCGDGAALRAISIQLILLYQGYFYQISLCLDPTYLSNLCLTFSL